MIFGYVSLAAPLDVVRTGLERIEEMIMEAGKKNSGGLRGCHRDPLSVAFGAKDIPFKR